MGRGQRGRGGRRGGNRGGIRGRPAPVLAPSGETALVTLKAELEFHEKLGDQECPAPLTTPDGAEEIQIKLDSWKGLSALLDWFKSGLPADEGAELMFSPKLSKSQRALIHSTAEQCGLDSVSRGVGEDRFISVVAKGRAQEERVSLNERQEHKAFWLWRWAGQEGIEVSRDEVAEMVRQDVVRPDLQGLWDRKSAQQKAVQQLCTAAAAGDLEGIKAILAANPAALGEGVVDVQTGVAPLHVAAKEGNIPAMELLMQAGAGAEWADGAGLTALQIARKFDQSDAEGLLLRAGARDPDARHWPGEQPLPPKAASGTTAAAAGGAAAGGAAAVPPSEGGESGSLGDSGASVCGTDMSRNVADVSSVQGDSLGILDGSDSLPSPKPSLAAPDVLPCGLEAVGEEGEGSGGTSEGEPGEGYRLSYASAPPSCNGGEEVGEQLADGRAGAGVPPQELRGVSRFQEDSRQDGAASGQAAMLGEYLSRGQVAGGGARRGGDMEDMESVRSVCGSEMTYQQSLDFGLTSTPPTTSPPPASPPLPSRLGQTIVPPPSGKPAGRVEAIRGGCTEGDTSLGRGEASLTPPPQPSLDAQGKAGVAADAVLAEEAGSPEVGDFGDSEGKVAGRVVAEGKSSAMDSEGLCKASHGHDKTAVQGAAGEEVEASEWHQAAVAAHTVAEATETVVAQTEGLEWNAEAVEELAATTEAVDVPPAKGAVPSVPPPPHPSDDGQEEQPGAAIVPPAARPPPQRGTADSNRLPTGDPRMPPLPLGPTARRKQVWSMTGYPEVDAAITEWGEWAALHKGSLLAGAGVVTGLLLILSGSGRHR